jgi:hypothetical protein
MAARATAGQPGPITIGFAEALTGNLAAADTGKPVMAKQLRPYQENAVVPRANGHT